jgi:hypothetical protein
MFQQQFKMVAEHSDWMPCDKATYQAITLNKPAAHILHGIPTEATYEKVTAVSENRYSDHHTEEVFQAQKKRRTQCIKGSMQEFATAIEYLAHRAHVELPEYLISTEATRVFTNGVSEQEIRRQLLLGCNKTLSEAVNEALDMEAANTAVGTSLRIRQMTPRKFEKSQSPKTAQGDY